MENLKLRIAKVVDKCKEDGTYMDPETGKSCIKAASKIKYFIEEFVGEIGIKTSIKSFDDFYVGYTEIKDKDGLILSTGHAKVFRNKPNSFECAETFSLSRALSFFGVMDDNITSKEEYDHIGIPLKERGSADVIEHPNSVSGMTYIASLAKVKLLGTPVEHIIELISKAKHPTRLHYIKNVSFAEEFNVALTRHPAVYRDLMDRYDVRMLQLNNQGAKKNG
jgi:hypothetical protein|tara:strand:- start:219 stop:884 length:666 start_codon:yes stop_codon:yes gene_type:complete